MAKKINLVAVNMGYGHQRAAYPLRSLSEGEVITFNDYPGIEKWEKNYWLKSERSYNRISRFKKTPLLGRAIFGIMDSFQVIKPYYPWRDLSARTEQQNYFFKSVKNGLGKKLIETLNTSGLPFVTTFFVAAYAAEYHNYQGDIYCVVCDSDASRAWAPVDPKNSRIKYFLPTEKLRKRFLMYGVKEENLFVTGFPLPMENIGPNKEILLADLKRRLGVLDQAGKIRSHYRIFSDEIEEKKIDKPRPLTLTFAVGGAGAQSEIGVLILNKLSAGLKEGKYHLNLVAGNRAEVNDYFKKAITESGLDNEAGLKIIYAPDKTEYFKIFNACLHETDVLWTKPSELSLYCALGLPIIISEPVGSQEDFNRAWLVSVGAGIDAEATEYVAEWLPDLLSSGRLARAAMDGFLNVESGGMEKIAELIN